MNVYMCVYVCVKNETMELNLPVGFKEKHVLGQFLRLVIFPAGVLPLLRTLDSCLERFSCFTPMRCSRHVDTP